MRDEEWWLDDNLWIAGGLALVLLAFWIGSAFAAPVACHRYSVWHYPWPQRCMAPHLQHLRPAPARVVSNPSAPVAMAARGPDGPPSVESSPLSAVPAPPPDDALELELEDLWLKRAALITPDLPE
jgi:hypothetical protein